MTAAARKFFVLHLVADALLLWLGYEWLGVGESTRWRLVWSALDALAILALACWLHGATLVFFRAQKAEISQAFRSALPRVPILLAIAVLVLAFYGLLAWAANASAQPAFRLASWMTMTLRTPVKPTTIARIFLAVFSVMRWMVLPVAFLPLACAIAADGWAGVRDLFAPRGWRYWLFVPSLLLAGLLIPYLILGWVPRVPNFTLEMLSFTVRILIAYLFFVTSLWTLERLTAGLKSPSEKVSRDRQGSVSYPHESV